jgi:hypothetical protein
MGNTDDPVSDQPAYHRIDHQPGTPLVRVMFSPRVLCRYVDAVVDRGLREAEAAANADEGDEWRLEAARQHKLLWHMARKLLSLEKMAYLCMALLEPPDGPPLRPYGLLAHGKDLSALAAALLDGAGGFHVPPVWDDQAALVMTRVDWELLYGQVITHLQVAMPRQMSGYAMGMQLMRNRLGADLPGIVGQLAPDVYTMVRLKPRADTARPEHEAAEHTPADRANLVPEFLVMWGLEDPRATRRWLSRAFTRLSGMPDTLPFVRKRIFRGRSIHCVGADVTQKDAFPDGTRSFGLLVADRYLALGSWERLTGIIRRIQAEGPVRTGRLPWLLQDNPNANFMLYLPAAAQQRMQNLANREGRGDIGLPDVPTVEDLHGIFQDEAFSRQVHERLARLLPALRTIVASAEERNRDRLVKGVHWGRFYEITAEEFE